MIITNVKIVTPKKVIKKGYINIKNDIISSVCSGNYKGKDKDVVDGNGKIAMPGFIDLHIHGSAGFDFTESSKDEVIKAARSLYEEGVTSFLATTLTSDKDSLKLACSNIGQAIKEEPSILGIHLEGPYISVKYKGAQNEEFIRKPDVAELNDLMKVSNNKIKYVTIAPEVEDSEQFIKYASKKGIVTSAGHSNATFEDVEKAINLGLTNTTHTHNAMSGHHHRNPGVLTAAFYFDKLFCECICDGIHVCPNAIKTFYKIVGPDRFMIITDALKAKHTDIDNMKIFGLDCVKKDGAMYLTTGPLAGSLLSMDKGIRNIKDYTGASLVELAKISSTNQARCLHLNDRGALEKGKLADIVLLDENLYVKDVYKLGKKVY